LLDEITVVLLTYNEAPNIERTLEQLRWARDIVVIDSFSDDDTLRIVSSFPQVRVFQRKFDSFAAQCNFGLHETGISSEWVLSLDADYVLTTELIEELGALHPTGKIQGYRARFTYCVNGYPLRSGVYPPVTVLFHLSHAHYRNDGHAHRIVIDGTVANLASRILHDDRKSLQRWFESQQRYMALEAKKLLGPVEQKGSTTDAIRRLRVVAPFAVLFYCLVLRGGLLDGWRGFFYAFQRMFAEMLLSIYLIEGDLKGESTDYADYTDKTVKAGEQVVP
jgi:glycosyltransferase involved in cell wall biosynthesis